MASNKSRQSTKPASKPASPPPVVKTAVTPPPVKKVANGNAASEPPAVPPETKSPAPPVPEIPIALVSAPKGAAAKSPAAASPPAIPVATAPPPTPTVTPQPFPPNNAKKAEPDDEAKPHRSELQRAVAAFASSLLINIAVLLVFGIVMLPDEFKAPLLGIIGEMPEPVKEEVKFVEPEKVKEPEVIDRDETKAEIVKKELARTEERFEININDLKPSANLLLDPNAVKPVAAAPFSGQFGGRSKAGRSALVAKYGGTKESETAVRTGLDWLLRHQKGDGSWSFDHRYSSCNCDQHGRFATSNMGATAMALLCFMGAGETYSEGEYTQAVERGLLYLINNGKMTPQGGDFRGKFQANGGMYIQGLVTIALCEALAMNEAERLADVRQAKGKNKKTSKSSKKKQRITPQRRFQVSRQLEYAATAALKFVATAQSSDGGWRYTPRVDSDTSVVGWQVMALASGHTAKIGIPPRTVAGARLYLDSVQSENGSQYAYVPGSRGRPKASMTAVGLLSRMYLGWTRENPGIRYGVEYLSKVGPSPRDMYYNYYATQVMHQYGGTLWEKWNKVMRDQLVNSQVKKGHAKGSWNLTDPHGSAGGRHYQTCLSIMTLEVYYRHMPLYEHRDLNEGAKGDDLAKTKSKDDKKKPGNKSPKKSPKAKPATKSKPKAAKSKS